MMDNWEQRVRACMEKGVFLEIGRGGVFFHHNFSFSWLFHNAAAPADANSATVSNSGEVGEKQNMKTKQFSLQKNKVFFSRSQSVLHPPRSCPCTYGNGGNLNLKLNLGWELLPNVSQDCQDSEIRRAESFHCFS